MNANDVELGPNHDNGFYLWPRGGEPVLCTWEPINTRRSFQGRVVVHLSKNFKRICTSIETAKATVAAHYSTY